MFTRQINQLDNIFDTTHAQSVVATLKHENANSTPDRALKCCQVESALKCSQVIPSRFAP